MIKPSVRMHPESLTATHSSGRELPKTPWRSTCSQLQPRQHVDQLFVLIVWRVSPHIVNACSCHKKLKLAAAIKRPLQP